MRKSLACLAALLPLLLINIACGPAECVNPLPDPAAPVRDAALAGTWSGMLDGDSHPCYVHIAIMKSGQVSLLIVGTDETEGHTPILFEGFVSKLGASSYLSLRNKIYKDPIGSDAHDFSPRYTIARYEVSPDGRLTLSYLDSDFAYKAVEAGLLEGKKEDGVTITASSEALAKFLQQTDPAKLFWPFGRFGWVKGPVAAGPAQKQ